MAPNLKKKKKINRNDWFCRKKDAEAAKKKDKINLATYIKHVWTNKVYTEGWWYLERIYIPKSNSKKRQILHEVPLQFLLTDGLD